MIHWGDAPIEMSGRRRPPHANDHAARCFHHFEARVGFTRELGSFPGVQGLVAELMAVKKRDVRGTIPPSMACR